MRLKLGLVMLLLAGACQKEKLESDTETTTAPAQTAEQQPAKETVKKEPVKKESSVTCDSLGIKSYELWISELSRLRCESCHNEKLAFNGIKFLTYEDWKAVADAAKNRIFTNELTKPLDVIEQGIFLEWFENGMPNTENDCVPKG